MTTMKKNYWMAGAMICALSLAATGCSNEELNESITGKRFTVTASTPAGGADTRISYDETNPASVSLAWEANDAIGVWKAGETTVNEFIAATAGGSADFTSTGGVTFTDGDQLYAVYPKPTAVTASNEVTLDLSAAQTGALDKNKQYMYASAAAASNTANFKFHHAVSVLKLTLTLPANAGTLTSVTLTATGLHNKATFNAAATPAPTITGTDAGNITATGNFANGTPIYLYAFPEALTGIAVSATDGTNVYEATLTDKTLVAGKVYNTPLTMALQIKFQNEGTAGIDGSTPEKAYTINNAEQLKLLSDRAATGTGNWLSKYYKLTSNIDLSRISSWTPIGTQNAKFNGEFDGDGFTISSMTINSTNSYQGLFAALESGKRIRNLNVSGTVKGDNSVGGIVGQNFGGTIENCSFSGSVEGNSIVGGICGATGGSGNLFIACRNSANVTVKSPGFGSGIGGIAASLAGSIVGCYNTGDITANNNAAANNAAGIVGMLNRGGAAYSCYNTGDIKIVSGVSAGQLTGSDQGGAYDNFTYLTGGSVTAVSGSGSGTGTNIQAVADAAAMNTQSICDMLNAGIKTWNTANTGKECNYHYVVGTGSNTTPVLVAGAPT